LLLQSQRCQEIWKELGLNEEDQASKFQDINALLLQKCSDELEGLEAAREKLQARIDVAYHAVKRLESVFDVADRVDVQTLASVAGPTLLEQEKYLLTVQKRLSDELWRRLSARIRMSEGIRELVAGLQIGSIEDFRHVSLEDVGTFDMDRIQASTAELTRLERCLRCIHAARRASV